MRHTKMVAQYTKMVARYNIKDDGSLKLVDVQHLETEQTAEELKERYSPDLRWTLKEWRDGTLEFSRRNGEQVSIMYNKPISKRLEKILCIPRDN
jgi:hypothetical protein